MSDIDNIINQLSNLDITNNENIEEEKNENIEEIVKTLNIELNNILEKWCNKHSNNCSGGEMRSNRGGDIEEFVKKCIDIISLKFNVNIKAYKGVNDKKNLSFIYNNKNICKEHQVDIHIYKDDIFIAVIECKSYLDSCYYVRACDDFKLFKKFNYNIKNYIFSLENSIDNDTKIFIDHINDNICDKIFYILDGKRNSLKPIYDIKYIKKVNTSKLKEFVEEIISLIITPLKI